MVQILSNPEFLVEGAAIQLTIHTEFSFEAEKQWKVKKLLSSEWKNLDNNL